MAAGKQTDTVERISPKALAQRARAGAVRVVDVRRPGEYAAAHLPGAENRPLDQINAWMNEIHSGTQPFVLHCQSGYRSMIAASILKARGVHEFAEVGAGFKAIQQAMGGADLAVHAE
jgi:rhodanese-related sulfurtransferase